MARHRDVHIDGGWYLIEITPDWERIHALQARIDLGDTKAMGEFIDLIVYEEETERYMDYVKRAAKMGYDKALYALHKPNNSVIPIKKLFVFRKLAKKGILDSRFIYDETKKDVLMGFLVLTIILAVIAVMIYLPYYLFNLFS